MTNEVIMLLKAVVMSFAEHNKNEILDCELREEYADASWRSSDQAKYYGVLSSIQEALEFNELENESDDWYNKLCEKDSDWDYVKDWIMEFDDWEDSVDRTASEECLEAYADEVKELIAENII